MNLLNIKLNIDDNEMMQVNISCSMSEKEKKIKKKEKSKRNLLNEKYFSFFVMF